jgi:pimeloyl-ACP methyl ester carboxylesterase
MEPAATRTFTVSRIIAVSLIAVLVGGLAYLRFEPDSRVSVPEGAKAGELTLEDCEYVTEDGSYAADCGALVVPENRADPGSRLIALPVTRIRARSSDPAEPIFRLEGGPGKTNMKFPIANRYAADHDVVLVGYRGVDGSERLDCPEVVSALKHSTDLLGEKSLRAYGDGLRSCAVRLQDEGVDLGGYTFTQRVEDFEAARRALGYERVNLLSESAGTRTALVYSWHHPESINRSVMVGANPPGNFVWDPDTTDEQVAQLAEACDEDAHCGERTDDLVATFRTTEIPKRWWFLPIKRGTVRVATFFGLHETTMENGPLNSPSTVDTWLSAADGDPSGLWLTSLLSDIAFPTSFVWGEMVATGRADANAGREYFSSPQGRSALGEGQPGTTFVWGGGRYADAFPPAPDADDVTRMRASSVETLLVNGSLDPTTPPQIARKQLLPYLPNGRHVVLEGFGHSFDFWTYQPEATTRLVTTYLDSGRVDRSLFEPQRVDFRPEVTNPALAKGFAGSMIGLAVLTLLSLLAMARRVRRRGGYGRKASAVLRSVYPIVLGLGGWLGGVLIVITTMPGVPLDDTVLTLTSIGVPVGLGVALAWVNRDSSRLANAAGVPIAVAGAFAGAWLGFNAATDLLALLTAIAGAIGGANLSLIGLDISRARRAERAERVEAAPQAAAG